MTNDTVQQSVLLIGKSQLVLDDAVAGLRALGHKADATNDFTDVTGRFDARTIDLIVFGGQVPPDRKAELKDELAAINPQIIFVQGLAGIPGLIVNQVQGAFTPHEQDPTGPPRTRARIELMTFCAGCRRSTVRRERDSPAKSAKFRSGVSVGRGRSSDGPRELRRSGELSAAEKASFCRPFLRAAEGIRTLDLLHGKQ